MAISFLFLLGCKFVEDKEKARLFVFVVLEENPQ